MTQTTRIDAFDSNITICREHRVADTELQILQVDIRQTYRSRLYDPSGYHLDLSLGPRTKTGMCFSGSSRADSFRTVGPLFLIPPGEEALTQTDQGRDVILVCRLPSRTIESLCETDLRWSREALMAGLDLRCIRLTQVMRRLADELSCPGFASGLLIEAIMLEIAIEVVRHSRSDVGKTDTTLSARCLRLIDDHLRIAPGASLASLAAVCGISIRQLSRMFRASRGMSIGKYVAEMQLEFARSRLAAGDSVKAVSYACGFCSPAAFCHSFRKSTGETPAQFRRSLPHARRDRSFQIGAGSFASSRLID